MTDTAAKRNHYVFIVIALFLIGLLNFRGSFGGGFLMDDENYIVKNPALFDPEFLQIQPLLPAGERPYVRQHAYFRPLYHLSMSAVAAFAGIDPLWFHVANFLLFYLACLTFVILVHLVTSNIRVAFLSGLLFFLHPVNGLLVNYANTTGYSLYLILSNGFLIYAVRYLRHPGNILYLLGAVAFWGLSLLCHEVALFGLIFFVVLIGLFFRDRWRESLIPLTACFALAVLYLSIRMKVVALPFSFFERLSFFQLSIPEFLATVSALMGWYIEQLVYPSRVVFMYQVFPVTEPVQVVLGLIVFCAFVLAAIRVFMKLKANLTARWGFSWMVAGIVMMIPVVVSRPNYGLIIEPHWLFYATFGFLLMFAAIWDRLFLRVNRTLNYCAMLAIILMLIAMSSFYNGLWSSNAAYLRHWLSINPQSYLANFWMGSYYLDRGELSEAKEYYEELAGRPYADWEVYVNLGVIAYRERRQTEAMRYFVEALKRNRLSADAYNNIGVIYRDREEFDNARAAFTKALELNPYHVHAKNNLESIQKMEQ